MNILIAFLFVVGSVTISFSQIRDVSSITTESKPIIVIDGKVLPWLIKSKKDSTKLVNPLEEIDPNDIERIDVLKDAAAAQALYGEQARYGVVVITTKVYTRKSKK